MSERERLAAHAEGLASHLIDRANDVEHSGSAEDVNVPALFRGAADTIRRLLTVGAPAPAGPWRAEQLTPEPDAWFVQIRPGKYDACHGPFTEAEAIAVRDALNARWRRGASPPEERHEG